MSGTDDESERPARRPRPPLAERTLAGTAISPGVAIGAVFNATEPVAEVVRRKITATDTGAQLTRLDAAVQQSRRQLFKLRARLGVLPEDSQAEIAPLLDAYLHMIGPSRLLRDARRRISETLVTAETAVFDAAEALAELMLAASTGEEKSARIRRAGEVREIARRLVRNLTHTPFRSFAAAPEGAVLICENLRPSDAALLDPARLAGIATDEGGETGHTAILLRALGLPTVMGVAGISEAVAAGETIVLDGTAGTVTLRPTATTLASARRAVTAFARERQKLARLRRLPAVMQDGTAISLQANMEIPGELPLIAQAGATGIGLLRSEFLFMNRESLPDEDAQTETYRAVIEAMSGDPVTIRVLDWGGEKDIEALQVAGLVPEVSDQNPALGVRGVRLLLERPELFETQLAAILRAAVAGPTRVLLPMVTTLREVRAARETYEKVVRRLRRRGERLPDPIPPLGIMIETPGAALAADAMATVADFFAVGTNDLAMYTLAVNRSDCEVAGLYDPLHPAVLRLIGFTAEAASRANRPISICGEMASNPRYVPLLLGLGLRSFSMNASAVPRVKQAVRATTLEACVALAQKVMEQTDPEAIHALVLGEATA